MVEPKIVDLSVCSIVETVVVESVVVMVELVIVVELVVVLVISVVEMIVVVVMQVMSISDLSYKKLRIIEVFLNLLIAEFYH